MMNFTVIYDVVLPLIFVGMAAVGLAIYLGTKFSRKR
jgi:hypothetical protein